jgi:subtilisin family serine protease
LYRLVIGRKFLSYTDAIDLTLTIYDGVFSKIIGARHYSFSSARDDLGHGSHTASTAAGNIVKKTSFYGLAQGTARGGVPSARISAYKVCGPGSCQSSDILSAFDDAIADGVDIITISIGGNQAQEFDTDVIAIGGFHSMAKGILTLQSAGNDGPVSGSVASVAPWIFTVAASSTDRRIIDKVVLGNGKTLVVCILESILLINYLIQSYTDSHTHLTTSISTHICIHAGMYLYLH